MKSEALLYVVAVLLFLLGFGLPEGDTPTFELQPLEPGALRVMTWNVGRASGKWGEPLSDSHIEHVARTVTEITPDVALLQEVRSGVQTGKLIEALDELGRGWSAEVSGGGRGRRVVALTRTGELTRSRPQDLSPSALALRFRRADGRVVDLIGLHADVTSAAERNEEIGSAVAALFDPEGFSDWPGRIFAGDLNIDLDLDKRRDLFTDDAHLDVETYNFVANHLVDAARAGGSTAEPDRRLDYLFVEESAFAVLRAGPLRGRRTGDMDHDPVVADLEFTDGP